MKRLATLAVIALCSSPTLALAMCPQDHGQQANSCPEGQVFDHNAGICVTSVTS